MKLVIFSLVLLFLTNTTQASEKDYWSTELPVIEGASDIEKQNTKEFYLLQKSYNLEVSNIDQVYDFYESFFNSINYKNPFAGKDFPKTFAKPKKWTSSAISYKESGAPVLNYASTWHSADKNFMGAVRLVLEDYKEPGIYDASITVQISPKVQTASLFELNNLLMESPENIFLLYDELGSDPSEILEVDMSKRDSDSQLVQRYFKIVDKIINEYQEFAEEHINQ